MGLSGVPWPVCGRAVIQNQVSESFPRFQNIMLKVTDKQGSASGKEPLGVMLTDVPLQIQNP